MIIIVSTYPDRETASGVARRLVDDGVAACVNMADIRSVYSWKGRTEDAEECIAVFKTRAQNRQLIRERIRQTHPYEVPEILEVGVADVNSDYARWVDGCTSGGGDDDDTVDDDDDGSSGSGSGSSAPRG